MPHEIHKVAITGTTSKIGQSILREAAQSAPGIEFVALVRNPSTLAGFNVETRPYDLSDSSEKIGETIFDVDSVIHLAGSSGEADNFALHEENIHQATRRIALAAARRGAAFLPIGSVSQHTGNRESLIDDNTPQRARGAYALSKIRAFQAAKEFETAHTRERGYKVIQLNPGMILGPDEKWTHELVATAKSGDPKRTFLLRAVLDSEIPWTDHEDLARLYVQIATNPYVALQDRYLAVNGMGDTNMILGTMYDLAGKPRLKPLPKKPVEAAIRSFLWLERNVLGKIPEASGESVSFAIYGHRRWITSSGLRREFGWIPKPLNQTLGEVKAGYKPEPL